MDTVLVVKDTFDVQVSRIDFASLMDSFACKCKHCQADIPISHDGIWITSIICITVLLLTLLVVGLILYIKSKNIYDKSKERKEKDDAENNQREKEREAEIEKEKNRYRQRLADFIELRAKGIKKDEKNEFDFNDDISAFYIKELRSFINELKPTDNSFPQKEIND